MLLTYWQSLLKSDPIYEAIGDVDELNSGVGLACELLGPSRPGETLTLTLTLSLSPSLSLSPGLRL
eukprot:scaffold97678_cov75-Phaeocystis_antarctica.AAC.3